MNFAKPTLAEIRSLQFVVGRIPLNVISYDRKGRIVVAEVHGQNLKFFGDGIVGKGPVNSWIARNFDGKKLEGRWI